MIQQNIKTLQHDWIYNDFPLDQPIWFISLIQKQWHDTVDHTIRHSHYTGNYDNAAIV